MWFYALPAVGLLFGLQKAIEQLNVWDIDPRLIERHGDALGKHGLELPSEHVIFRNKWSSSVPD